MLTERHYRLLRGLWLAVFYAVVGVMLVLAALDWRRHAVVIAGLGLVLCNSVGALWLLLFPTSYWSKRSRTLRPSHLRGRQISSSQA